jgi:hypothetical protein
VWRIVKKADFMFLYTWNLNQDRLQNTSGAICSYCGLNNHPVVRHFIDAQKTSIINDLAYRGLCGTNCENDGATLWITYNCCSEHLIMLYKIPPRVITSKRLMKFVRVCMLLGMYRRT